MGFVLSYNTPSEVPIEYVPSYLQYRELSINYKTSLELARISKADPARPDEQLEAYIGKVKSRFAFDKAMRGLYLRGFVHHSAVFYHNSVTPEIRKALPLIHDGIHFRDFPGVARQLTGNACVGEPPRLEPLGMDDLLHGSFKVYLTQTP